MKLTKSELSLIHKALNMYSQQADNLEDKERVEQLQMKIYAQASKQEK